MSGLAQKQASIITGGGRGIGKAISLRLAESTNVILVGRTESDLETTCGDINGLDKCKAVYVAGDVREPETAAKAVAQLKNNRWILKNLICNAGIGKSGALHEFDHALWHEILDVNVLGAFNFSKKSLPLMLEQGQGTICIMGSVAGLDGVSHDSAYSSSKHALVGLAKSMAKEYAKRGITVAALCPSFVESDMTARSISSLMTRKNIAYEEAQELIAKSTPLGRILPAEELAELVHVICEGKIVSPSKNPVISAGDLASLYKKYSSPSLDDLVDWIKDTTSKARGLLVPISGGSDSALCFYLCAAAYPEKTIAVYAGDPQSLRERGWFEKLARVEYVQVPGEYHEREAMRWAKFNAMSSKLDAWLVGSRNKTEDLLGTYSLASRLATVLPIAGVWKSDVLTLCKSAGVPDSIPESSLKADPDCGRPSEMAAISYGKIEHFLKEKIGIYERDAPSVSNNEREYLENVYNHNLFKKSLPIKVR